LSVKENQIEQARQVKNQTKQTKQTNPVSTVCPLDAPLYVFYAQFSFVFVVMLLYGGYYHRQMAED
jgi:hypothetical protein